MAQAETQRQRSVVSQFDVALAIYNAGTRVSKLIASQNGSDENGDGGEWNELGELRFQCVADGCETKSGRVFESTVGFFLSDKQRWVPRRLQGRFNDALQIVVEKPVLEDGRLNVVCGFHASAVLKEGGHVDSLYWTLSWLERIEQEAEVKVESDDEDESETTMVLDEDLLQDLRDEFDAYQERRNVRRNEERIIKKQTAEMVDQSVSCFGCENEAEEGSKVKKFLVMEMFGFNLRGLEAYTDDLEERIQQQYSDRDVGDVLREFDGDDNAPNIVRWCIVAWRYLSAIDERGQGQLPLFFCGEHKGDYLEALTGKRHFNYRILMNGEKIYLTTSASEILERQVRSRRNRDAARERTKRTMGNLGDICPELKRPGRSRRGQNQNRDNRGGGRRGGRNQGGYHSGGQPY